MRRTGFLAILMGCSLLSAATLLPQRSFANDVPVRFSEGLSRGFVVVSTETGQKIAEGESEQVANGGQVKSRLTIHFTDGSLYDDRAVFTQRKVFHLLTDHLIENGPSFKQPLEMTIDTPKDEVQVRYTNSHGTPKFLSRHMDLPEDVANGLIFTVVKDMDPHTSQTRLSYVAATPEPRLVYLIFKPMAEDVLYTDGAKRQALHYVMSIDITGVTGVIARVFGKKPKDTDLWVIDGEAPTFAASRGPLYNQGPIWQISLVSPTFSPGHTSETH